MSLAVLALVCAAGVLGPVLATPRRFGVPLVVGELLAGVLLGPMLLDVVPVTDPTVSFLAQVGFALVMFVAGSHVPVHDARLRRALPVGVGRALLVGVAAAVLGFGVAAVAGTGHGPLYAVLMTSSSAALVLPVLQSAGADGEVALPVLSQVAVADAACIVAVPLVVDPGRAGRAAAGAAAVVACAVVLYAVLRYVDRRGWRHAVHELSEHRKFALELRVNLALLFALAAVASFSGVSVMLAGFAFGLVVRAVGEPRRLARQLFAVTEGFLGPLFFVWLGASLDLRALGARPAWVGLGITLGLAAVLAHLAAVPTRQPVALAALSSAQVGVPVAAAALGAGTGLLAPGEPAALVLGALVTIVVASAAGRTLVPSRS